MIIKKYLKKKKKESRCKVRGPLDPIKEELGLKSEMVSLVRYNLS
jgi:hypothetical protein